MCTLIVLFRAFESLPLVVAANRDEKLDRASEAPSALTHGGMSILCPRDRVGGGTWLGINARGLFVGITNRFGVPPHPDRRSRGLIVLDALAAPTAAVVREQLAGLDAARENAFHLVVADSVEAYVIVNDGQRIVSAAIEPGLCLVTERSFGAAPSGRERVIRERLEPFQTTAPSVDALSSLLGSHDDGPFDSVCVHVPELSYGTRSSTILRRMEPSGAFDVRFADGPPCVTPYVPILWRGVSA